MIPHEWVAEYRNAFSAWRGPFAAIINVNLRSELKRLLNQVLENITDALQNLATNIVSNATSWLNVVHELALVKREVNPNTELCT